MNAMRTLLVMLVVLAITLVVLLAGATGVGALLNLLMPSVGLGTAILIGVLALSVCANFVLSLLGQANTLRDQIDEAEFDEVVAVVHPPPRGRRPRR